MIRNIIFDWSGVIKDSVHDHLYVVNSIFRKFNSREITLEELKETWTQPYMLFYNKYLPDLTVEQEMAAYKDVIMTCPEPKPYPGIVDLIKELRNRDFKMTVISSDLPQTLLVELTSFGLNNIFEEVATEVYDKTSVMVDMINKFGFDKSETIAIGDSNHEIEAAQEIGIRSIAVTWGFTLEKRLIAAKPDYVVNKLEELRVLLDISA